LGFGSRVIGSRTPLAERLLRRSQERTPFLAGCSRTPLAERLLRRNHCNHCNHCNRSRTPLADTQSVDAQHSERPVWGKRSASKAVKTAYTSLSLKEESSRTPLADKQSWTSNELAEVRIIERQQ
jgi:hypothetical protein